MGKTSILITALLLLLMSGRVGAAEERRLVVGYDPEFPPVHFAVDGQPQGFAVDLMNEIASRMSEDILYVPVPQSEGVRQLKDNELDILLSAYFNEEHAGMMEFSDSILTTSIGLIVHRDNETIEGLAELTDAVTALQKDTLEYDFLRNIRSIQYHVASNQVTALELLLKGRANAFVGNVLTAEYVLAARGLEDDYKIVGNYLLPVDYTMAVQQENYQLLSRINEAIREMKADGTYSLIYEDWFERESELEGRLWLALQIIGGLLLVATALFLLGMRWNKQLQREVAKKTNVLQKMNVQLEQKMAEIKNSDEFQKQILNSSPRGIATINAAGLVTSFNQKAHTISGERQSVAGRHYAQIPLLNLLLEGRFADVLRPDNLILGEEAVWQKNETNTYYLRYYIYPLKNFEKQVIGLIVTFEDITEEHKLRLQLFEREKNEELSRIVAGIAHEIRNPLTSIKTFVELIPHKYNNARFQNEISAYVPQEIERMNQLIQGLIDYTKPARMNKERIDAGAVVRECLILFERTALHKGITMQCTTEGNLWIEADANQLKQVLINLIINGLDAINSGDEQEKALLQLAAFEKGPSVCIQVTDTGEGMNDYERRQALKLFYTTKAKGTGLGLAIASQYIKENNGELEINSEKGAGTTITLTFLKAMEKEAAR
ncbi:transporter substrate-binding domain-containing protein [Halalkalibacter oceani]|uniref:transporter substrate-binding domain-containing protein n=1 Tax=Halalkalibacter oceani TaxID=1653776 RepID=UPI003392E5F4